MNTIYIAICTTNWLPGITLSEASKLAPIPYFYSMEISIMMLYT